MKYLSWKGFYALIKYAFYIANVVIFFTLNLK